MAILSTPSPTLYVSGLETKTKKQELKQQLYALFSPYGRVIDVVAKKHDGGRGQAFVVFEEQVAATAALRALTGETFYNKELVRLFQTSICSKLTVSREYHTHKSHLTPRPPVKTLQLPEKQPLSKLPNLPFPEPKTSMSSLKRRDTMKRPVCWARREFWRTGMKKGEQRGLSRRTMKRWRLRWMKMRRNQCSSAQIFPQSVMPILWVLSSLNIKASSPRPNSHLLSHLLPPIPSPTRAPSLLTQHSNQGIRPPRQRTRLMAI
ncbi:hypothetical protein I305_06378 [Cryptococcus gattii E566]|nr:hypothetical protein I305_06378 [Cryptococcus gattii E566]